MLVRSTGTGTRPASSRHSTAFASCKPTGVSTRVDHGVSRSSAHPNLRTFSRSPALNVAATLTLSKPKGTLGTQALTAAFASNAPVVILGAQGASAIRVVKSLLEAGAKVTAGIDAPEQAKATLDFVKRYELLSKAQLANLKLADPDAPLPKGARVVLWEGDVVGDNKVDTRAVEAALEKASDSGAAQFILITSVTGSGGGGLFGFGAPNPSIPNKGLTRSEQLVTSSGIPSVVVRVSVSEGAAADSGVVIKSGPGAVAPASAPITQDALSNVLSAVLGQALPPAGVPVVLEVAGVPGADTAGVSAAVAAAVEEAKAKAPPSAPAVKKESSPAPGRPVFSLGTVSIKRASTVREEEDEEPKVAVRKPAPAPPKPAPKVAAKPVAKKDEDEDDEEEAKGTGPVGWLGTFLGVATGTARVKVASPPPAKATPPPPAVRTGTTTVARAGTTSVRVTPRPSTPKPVYKPNPFSSVKSKRPVSEERADEDDVKVVASKPSTGGGVFGFFAVAPQAPPAAKEAPAPAARKPVQGTQSRAASPTPAAPPAPKRSSGGLFGGLFGGKPARSDDDEEEEVSPKARFAPAPRKATPPPPAKPAPKPAPKPAARTTSPPPPVEKPRGNPFSTVKRSVQPPAPAKPAPKPAPKPAAKPAPPTKPASTGTTKSRSTPAPPSTGTGYVPRGTYRPVSGFSVEPKKK